MATSYHVVPLCIDQWAAFRETTFLELKESRLGGAEVEPGGVMLLYVVGLCRFTGLAELRSRCVRTNLRDQAPRIPTHIRVALDLTASVPLAVARAEAPAFRTAYSAAQWAGAVRKGVFVVDSEVGEALEAQLKAAEYLRVDRPIHPRDAYAAAQAAARAASARRAPRRMQMLSAVKPLPAARARRVLRTALIGVSTSELSESAAMRLSRRSRETD